MFEPNILHAVYVFIIIRATRLGLYKKIIRLNYIFFIIYLYIKACVWKKTNNKLLLYKGFKKINKNNIQDLLNIIIKLIKICKRVIKIIYIFFSLE